MKAIQSQTQRVGTCTCPSLLGLTTQTTNHFGSRIEGTVASHSAPTRHAYVEAEHNNKNISPGVLLSRGPASWACTIFVMSNYTVGRPLSKRRYEIIICSVFVCLMSTLSIMGPEAST